MTVKKNFTRHIYTAVQLLALLCFPAVSVGADGLAGLAESHGLSDAQISDIRRAAESRATESRTATPAAFDPQASSAEVNLEASSETEVATDATVDNDDADGDDYDDADDL